IIRELLLEFTQFTLAPTLSADFPGNLFDYYLENASPAFEDPDISPIPAKAPSSFITPQPENLDDPFSLPLYNEDTTVINFPPQRNSLPNTVYPIHPEETNPVPSIIVDINPPNEEPIRTPTTEAPLANQPVQALTDAANAINALAVALGQAMAYMKDNAQEWPSSLANAPNHFQNNNHGQNNHNGHPIEDNKRRTSDRYRDSGSFRNSDPITNLIIDPGHEDEIDPKEEILTAMIDPE
ncbi:40359_t:CDS:2, partial [Gigaspora margarita]